MTSSASINNEKLEEAYEITRITSWIKDLGLKRIALQFPDQLLKDAPDVALNVEKASQIDVNILGDTSYGSCCVDVHAASCIGAGGLVHFGPACLSQHEKMPVLYIFEKLVFDCQPFLDTFTGKFLDEDNILFACDLKYHETTKKLAAELSSRYKNILYLEPNTSSDHKQVTEWITVSGRSCQLPAHTALETFAVLYIGEEGPTLTNFIYSLNKHTFYTYNPIDCSFSKDNLNVNQHLRKRYYLIQKAKDARLIGILVATLGVADHLNIIEHIKMLAKSAGKKCYTFVVGKLNPQKLANFPEIDCFVTVACPENSLLDSKEFYRPVITPFEFEMTVNSGRSWTGDYITDFRQILPGAAKHVPLQDIGRDEETDVSLISGQIRLVGLDRSETVGDSTNKDVCNRDQERLSVLAVGSDFLRQREWTGLEPHVGETPVTTAQSGRKGLAAGYQHEGVASCDDDNCDVRGKPDGQE